MAEALFTVSASSTMPSTCGVVPSATRRPATLVQGALATANLEIVAADARQQAAQGLLTNDHERGRRLPARSPSDLPAVGAE